ncbi:MAG: L,D-transpeptidase family protein [Methylotenera sp.]
MQLIQKFKFFKAIFVTACIVLPWNATAINHGSLADQLLGKKFGRNLVESLLVKSLLEITEGRTKQAFDTVDELIRAAPNFKLAYLIRGDLLASQGRALKTFGDSNAISTGSKPSSEEIEGLRNEARTRIEYYLSEKKTSQQPNLLVKLSNEQEHLIVVDAAKSRLFLYKKVDGALQYVADYYVTIGKNGSGKQVQGDKRTPLGVYFAGQKITQQLADMYGDAAYPLNYPNELDQHLNKNGSGIWLHGTPTNTYSRPPRASDGCVVLSNPDLKALAPVLQTGKTPVIIASNLEWLESDQSDEKLEAQEAEKQALQKAIEDWRKDWVAQNTDGYLSHYSKKFFYSDGGFDKWADYKRSVQAAKSKVSIQLEDISMFGYPDSEQPIIVVNFEQDFKSQTLQNKMRKRQYWVNENNQWKIIYEGAG